MGGTGPFYQGSAVASLKSDLGSSNYFSELTIVAWVKFTGWNSSLWGRLLALGKYSSADLSTSHQVAVSGLQWDGHNGNPINGWGLQQMYQVT